MMRRLMFGVLGFCVMSCVPARRLFSQLPMKIKPMTRFLRSILSFLFICHNRLLTLLVRFSLEIHQKG